MSYDVMMSELSMLGILIKNVDGHPSLQLTARRLKLWQIVKKTDLVCDCQCVDDKSASKGKWFSIFNDELNLHNGKRLKPKE
jgi:hypothetical protein